MNETDEIQTQTCDHRVSGTLGPQLIGQVVTIITLEREETCGDELKKPIITVGKLLSYQYDTEDQTFAWKFEGGPEGIGGNLHQYRIEVWPFE